MSHQTHKAVTSVLVALALALPGTAAAAADGQVAAVPLTTGADDRGQQGNGVGGGRTSPAVVDGPAAVAVASGRDHGYLLDAAGHVLGWGANDKGQVGDGSRVDRATPVDTGLDDVVQIEAGHYHGIALRSDGSVWTWGYGWLGQLGTGERSVRTRPVRVPGLSGVTAVAAGRDMSYALRADGTVAAWGNNAYGEVGDGTTTRRLSPVTVSGLRDVVELSGGRDHGLARTTSGAVWAWGDNRYGQLGDGTTTRRTTPVQVLESGVSALDAGAHHSVAVTTDGAVLAWGRGYRGQLGLGGTANRSTPTPVPGLPAAVEVGDGRDQSFAVTAAGDVWAWGQNADGQLGDGSTTTRTRPVRLSVSGIGAVQSGSSHTVLLPDVGEQPPPPPPANADPTAVAAVACEQLTCVLDGGGSTDADGSVATYSWDTGDGASLAGRQVSHTYAAAGTYRVVLTVTDDRGATGTTARDVTVAADPSPGQDVSVVGATSSNTNARTHRVALPADVRAGDGLVLVLSLGSDRTVADPAGVTGWTPVTSVADRELRTVVWRRTARAGDAGATVSVPLSGRAKASLVAVGYRGTGPDVVTAATVAVQTGSSATYRTPSVDAASSGSRLLSLWAVKSSATTALTPPDGEAVLAASATVGNGRVVALATDSGPVGPGGYGALAATGDAASGKATMVSLVVGPAG